MKAIISIQSKQYVIEKGSDILLDRVEDSSSINPDVLLVYDENRILFEKNRGQSSPSVTFDLLNDDIKGEKILILKKKRRKNHRKMMGFRHKHTIMKIQDIIL